MGSPELHTFYTISYLGLDSYYACMGPDLVQLIFQFKIRGACGPEDPALDLFLTLHI